MLLGLISLTGCQRASLDIVPQHFDECSGPLITAHVDWRVTSDHSRQVGIYVQDTGYPEKLFMTGGPEGNAATGKWVKDGLTFILRDSSGKRLVTKTVTTSPCHK